MGRQDVHYVTQVILVDKEALTAQELFGKDPARVVEKAVKGMLPKNKLGAALFRNLKVYVRSRSRSRSTKTKNH